MTTTDPVRKKQKSSAAAWNDPITLTPRYREIKAWKMTNAAAMELKMLAVLNKVEDVFALFVRK